MRIRTRIVLVNIAAVLIAVGITLTVAVNNIRRQGERDIAIAREGELEATKKRLRDVVDMAYSLLERNWQGGNDAAYLKMRYGNTLQAVVDSAECMLMPGEVNLTGNGRMKIFDGILRQYFEQSRIVLLVVRLDDGKIIGGNLSANLVESERLQDFFRKHGRSRSRKFITFNGNFLPRFGYLIAYPDKGVAIFAAVTAEAVRHDMMELSKEELRYSRYDNGTGYVFAFSTDGVNIVHPVLRYLEGTDMSLVRDSKGKLLVTEIIKTSLKENEGFVSYTWVKPQANKPDLPDIPKITYVKLFKPWMWVLGSGAYIDNIDEMARGREKDIRSQVDALVARVLFWGGGVVLLLALLSLLLARSVSRPLEKLTVSMQELDVSGAADKNIALRGSAEIIQLGRIFNRMQQSIHDGVKRIREATVAREKAEGELKLAGEIQHDLIPKIFPPFTSGPEFDFYAVNYPATSGCCGIHDFFHIDQDRVGLLMGSVTRSGVAGALYHVVVRTMVRTRAMSGANPGTVLNEINAMLLRNRRMKIFVSLFFGILNVRTGELFYSNAGYSFPLLFRSLRTLEDLPTLHGEALCVQRNHCYSYDRMVIGYGDILILYSESLLRCSERGKGIPRTEFRSRIEECLRQTAEDTISQCISTVEGMYNGAVPDEDVTFAALNLRGPSDAE